MGMYTQIETDFVIPWEGTEAVRSVLMGMLSLTDYVNPRLTQSHEFFFTERWHMLLRGTSAYFDRPCFTLRDDEWFNPGGGYLFSTAGFGPASQGKEMTRGLRLQSQSNIKNYDDEIGKFADWIRPYCLDQADPIVISTYEEYPDNPTLYYKDGTVKRHDHSEGR